MRKRILMLLMACYMILTFLPMSASAESENQNFSAGNGMVQNETEGKSNDKVSTESALVESDHPHSPDLSEMASIMSIDDADDETAVVFSASDRGDTYPDEYKNAVKDALVDKWNFYNRECTSFVAWCLNSRNGIPFTNQYGGVTRWGNAKEWGEVAKKLGYSDNMKCPQHLQNVDLPVYCKK